MSLSEQEIEHVASKLHGLIVEDRRNFWVEPERHYNEHMNLREMIKEWKALKSMFWKAFFGFAIFGAIVSAGIGSLIKFVR